MTQDFKQMLPSTREDESFVINSTNEQKSIEGATYESIQESNQPSIQESFTKKSNDKFNLEEHDFIKIYQREIGKGPSFFRTYFQDAQGIQRIQKIQNVQRILTNSFQMDCKRFSFPFNTIKTSNSLNYFNNYKAYNTYNPFISLYSYFSNARNDLKTFFSKIDLETNIFQNLDYHIYPIYQNYQYIHNISSYLFNTGFIPYYKPSIPIISTISSVSSENVNRIQCGNSEKTIFSQDLLNKNNPISFEMNNMKIVSEMGIPIRSDGTPPEPQFGSSGSNKSFSNISLDSERNSLGLETLDRKENQSIVMPNLSFKNFNASFQSESNNKLFKKMIAATFSSMVTTLVVTPFDVIKTHMQYNKEYCCRYGSTWRCANHIVEENGFKALWKGLRVSLVHQVPATGLYYTTYEQIKKFITREFISEEYAPIFAGSISRAFVIALTCPFEYIRTAIQAQDINRGFFEILNFSVKKYGVTRLWNGLGVTALRDIPFSAIYWFEYEKFKSYLERNFSSSLPNTSLNPLFIHFMSGATSGIIASIFTHPFDVIKTRIQGNVDEKITFKKALTQVISERAYFDGLRPRVLRVGSSCAIMISTFELMKKYLDLYD